MDGSNKQYQIVFDLSKDLLDIEGHCWFPVFSNYHHLEQEELKYNWYFGTYFFKKYFTVYDNSPAEEGEDFNYIGIGACSSHTDHVEIADDDE